MIPSEHVLCFKTLMAKHFRMILVHGTVMMFIFFISWQLAFSGHFMDWDMRYFATMVQAEQKGPRVFTPVHNLLNELIFRGAFFLKPLVNRFDAFLSVKLLAVFFSGSSAYLLFLTALSLTRDMLLALCASLAWFILPGNMFLMLSLEDNVWANFFNVLFIFQILVLTRYVQREHAVIPLGAPYALLIGICLSIGINLHQQLVPLLYVFPFLILFSRPYSFSQWVTVLSVFILGYTGASALQNYIMFSDCCWKGILTRLWFNPYHVLFPQYWYFTSGYALSEWMHKISIGLTKSFFSDRIILICFLMLGSVSVAGIFSTVIRYCRQRSAVYRKKLVLLMLLSFMIGIYVPYSLLYEPWSVERWDATFPGLIILVTYFYSIGVSETEYKFLYIFKKLRVHALICTAMLAWLLNQIFWLA